MSPRGNSMAVPPLWRKFDGTQRVSTLPCEHPGVLKLLADFPTSLFECVHCAWKQRPSRLFGISPVAACELENHLGCTPPAGGTGLPNVS
jgi:hypothetical protein